MRWESFWKFSEGFYFANKMGTKNDYDGDGIGGLNAGFESLKLSTRRVCMGIYNIIRGQCHLFKDSGLER